MIIALNGIIGSGKTLTMTYLGYKQYKKGSDIVSNYRLNFPHKIVTKQDIENYAKSDTQLKNCTFLFDEAHIFLDCRTSAKNIVNTYFILQSRKRGVDIYYSTQYFGQVDKRLRDQTDLVFECTAIKKSKKVKTGNKTTTVKLLKAIKIDVFRHKGQGVLEKLKKFVIRNPEKLFKLYNTYEIINFEK